MPNRMLVDAAILCDSQHFARDLKFDFHHHDKQTSQSFFLNRMHFPRICFEISLNFRYCIVGKGTSFVSEDRFGKTEKKWNSRTVINFIDVA